MELHRLTGYGGSRLSLSPTPKSLESPGGCAPLAAQSHQGEELCGSLEPGGPGRPGALRFCGVGLGVFRRFGV